MALNSTQELIQKYLDDYATAAELGGLGTVLAENPTAAELFANAARTEAVLEECLCDERLRLHGPVAPRAKIRSRPPVYTAALVAAVILLIVGTAILHQFGGEQVVVNDVVSGRVLVDGVETVAIVNGSRLEVAGDHAALIRLVDGSHAEFAPETQALLRGRVGHNREVIEMDRGGGKFQVGKGGRGFRLETPVGTVTGSNSEFSVELRSTDEIGVEPMSEKVALLLAVAVMAGNVEVHSEGQNYVVASGQSYVFTAQEKGARKIPSVAGKVVAVSVDAKRLTLETPPPKPGAEPGQHEIKITDRTELVYYGVEKDGDCPTVGYPAFALLDETDREIATRVQFGAKEAQLQGRVVEVSADGRRMSLEVYRKGEKPGQIEVKLTDRSRLLYNGVDKDGEKPTVGYAAQVWLKEGAADTAMEVRFFLKNKGESKSKQPASAKSPMAPEKPKPNKTEEAVEPKPSTKPEPPPKPPERASTRDPKPIAAAVDLELNKRLNQANTPTSPQADDGEFLRRVTLDIAGRIPTYDETITFLNSQDPDKRRQWIDQLLASSDYGLHFGTIWRNLLVPKDATKGSKAQPDRFSPWLAEQFVQNRGWHEIVLDLLTFEGDIAQHPESAFIIANSEGFQPQADRLAAASARFFLGVQLQCAQCHNHPFAPWKQTDFWSTAAFFSRLRNTSQKGPPFVLTEEPAADPPEGGKKGAPVSPPTLLGAAIQIPSSTGSGAGRVVKAKFLSGEEPVLDVHGPFRPAFAAWITAAENPYFARAAVNRLWAHFFGRGLVNPVDNFHDGNPPSHPELLDLLANEFRASGYDLKHLIRCLCTSAAYQRTSRPLPQNEADDLLFSHMVVKVMSPEVFYDSLATAMAAGPAIIKKGSKPAAAKGTPPYLESREQFVHSFAAQGEPAEAGQYGYGIPQFLKLMNAEQFNKSTPMVERWVKEGTSPDKIVEGLYLAVLSRRPSVEEARLMSDYLAKRDRSANGYAGVFWILSNSSEFALNH
jgi:hypothetical protein